MRQKVLWKDYTVHVLEVQYVQERKMTACVTAVMMMSKEITSKPTSRLQVQHFF